MNTGALRDHTGRPVRFGMPGMADILATPVIHPPDSWTEIAILWIECKAPNGTQSKLQREFQGDVELSGHKYLLVRDVNELAAWLKERKAI